MPRAHTLLPHAVARLIAFRDKYRPVGWGWQYAFRTWNVRFEEGRGPRGFAKSCGAAAHMAVRCVIGTTLFPCPRPPHHAVSHARKQQRQRVRSLRPRVVGGEWEGLPESWTLRSEWCCPQGEGVLSTLQRACI